MRTLLTLIVLSTIALAVILHKQTLEYQTLKVDYIEINRIKYGILNIDRWKEIVLSIVDKKIEDLRVTKTNKEVLRKDIQKILYSAINSAEKAFEKDEIIGFRRWAFDPFGRAREQVPKITNDTLNFFKDKDNRSKVKSIIKEKLNKYANKTFSSIDYSLIDEIKTRYGEKEVVQLEAQIKSLLEDNKKQTEQFKWILYLLAISIALLLIIEKKNTKITVLSGLVASVTFLSIGLLLPMIELDARISTLSMNIMGESVNFQNQVLFYQSKSIIDVIWLLASNDSIEVATVGILIFCFSILFPTIKLSSCVVTLFKPHWGKNPILYFFTHKSGKWSMADVFIVGIFMTYIGFNNVVSEQLGQISGQKEHVNVLTTNETSLMLGFFAFMIFVIISIITSSKIKIER